MDLIGQNKRQRAMIGGLLEQQQQQQQQYLAAAMGGGLGGIGGHASLAGLAAAAAAAQGPGFPQSPGFGAVQGNLGVAAAAAAAGMGQGVGLGGVGALGGGYGSAGFGSLTLPGALSHAGAGGMMNPALAANYLAAAAAASRGHGVMHGPASAPSVGTSSRPMPVVKLRGMPYSCSELDVLEFFGPLDVVDVLLVRKGQRFTGEAFVVFGSTLQVEYALQKNRQNMGRRYVEVFRCKREDYYRAITYELQQQKEAQDGTAGSGGGAFAAPDGRQDGPTGDIVAAGAGGQTTRSKGDVLSNILKLRGLPYAATKQDVIDFFADVTALGEGRIQFVVVGEGGQHKGEVFVEFESTEQANVAMMKDCCKMGTRYVEIFPSNADEATRVMAYACAGR